MANFTRTQEKRSADAATYTTQPMAKPFGWQGEKKPRRASQMSAPRAQASSLGNVEPGRVADFVQGANESHDQRAKTAAIMVGAYVGVRALQHWSPWRRHQG